MAKVLIAPISFPFKNLILINFLNIKFIFNLKQLAIKVLFYLKHFRFSYYFSPRMKYHATRHIYVQARALLTLRVRSKVLTRHFYVKACAILTRHVNLEVLTRHLYVKARALLTLHARLNPYLNLKYENLQLYFKLSKSVTNIIKDFIIPIIIIKPNYFKKSISFMVNQLTENLQHLYLVCQLKFTLTKAVMVIKPTSFIKSSTSFTSFNIYYNYFNIYFNYYYYSYNYYNYYYDNYYYYCFNMFTYQSCPTSRQLPSN